MLQVLERLAQKLVLCPSSDLETNLKSHVPQLLLMSGSESERIRQKTVQVFEDIMTRLRHEEAMGKVPLPDLAVFLSKNSSKPLQKHLALVLWKLGASSSAWQSDERCSRLIDLLRTTSASLEDAAVRTALLGFLLDRIDQLDFRRRPLEPVLFEELLRRLMDKNSANTETLLRWKEEFLSKVVALQEAAPVVLAPVAASAENQAQQQDPPSDVVEQWFVCFLVGSAALPSTSSARPLVSSALQTMYRTFSPDQCSDRCMMPLRTLLLSAEWSGATADLRRQLLSIFSRRPQLLFASTGVADLQSFLLGILANLPLFGSSAAEVLAQFRDLLALFCQTENPAPSAEQLSQLLSSVFKLVVSSSSSSSSSSNGSGVYDAAFESLGMLIGSIPSGVGVSDEILRYVLESGMKADPFRAVPIFSAIDRAVSNAGIRDRLCSLLQSMVAFDAPQPDFVLKAVNRLFPFEHVESRYLNCLSLRGDSGEGRRGLFMSYFPSGSRPPSFNGFAAFALAKIWRDQEQEFVGVSTAICGDILDFCWRCLLFSKRHAPDTDIAPATFRLFARAIFLTAGWRVENCVRLCMLLEDFDAWSLEASDLIRPAADAPGSASETVSLRDERSLDAAAVASDLFSRLSGHWMQVDDFPAYVAARLFCDVIQRLLSSTEARVEPKTIWESCIRSALSAARKFHSGAFMFPVVYVLGTAGDAADYGDRWREILSECGLHPSPFVKYVLAALYCVEFDGLHVPEVVFTDRDRFLTPWLSSPPQVSSLAAVVACRFLGRSSLDHDERSSASRGFLSESLMAQLQRKLDDVEGPALALILLAARGSSPFANVHALFGETGPDGASSLLLRSSEHGQLSLSDPFWVDRRSGSRTAADAGQVIVKQISVEGRTADGAAGRDGEKEGEGEEGRGSREGRERAENIMSLVSELLLLARRKRVVFGSRLVDSEDAALMESIVRFVLDRLAPSGPKSTSSPVVRRNVLYLMAFVCLTCGQTSATVQRHAVDLQAGMLKLLSGLIPANDNDYLGQLCVDGLTSLYFGLQSTPRSGLELQAGGGGGGGSPGLEIQSLMSLRLRNLLTSNMDAVTAEVLKVETNETSSALHDLAFIAHEELGDISLTYYFMALMGMAGAKAASGASLLSSRFLSVQRVQLEARQRLAECRIPLDAAAAGSDLHLHATHRKAVVDSDHVFKLYRQRFHANPRVREVMELVFVLIVGEAQRLLQRPPDAGRILQDLLSHVEDRSWRDRETVVRGLADFLRNVPAVGFVTEVALRDVVRAYCRLADDTREPVRKLAESEFRGPLVRFLVKGSGSSDHGRMFVGVVIDLFQQSPALGRRVLERMLATDRDDDGEHAGTQVRSSDESSEQLLARRLRLQALGPFLPQLTALCLQQLSSEEVSELSYLQMHAAGAGLSQEDVEGMRVEAATSSRNPTQRILDQTVHLLDDASVPELISRLSDILKAGVGLLTLVAAAKIVIFCAHFRPKGLRDSKQAVLRKTLLRSIQLERSWVAKRYFAQALAALLGVASKAQAVDDVFTEFFKMATGIDLRALQAGGSGDMDLSISNAAAVAAADTTVAVREVGALVLAEMFKSSRSPFLSEQQLDMIVSFSFIQSRERKSARIADMCTRIWDESINSAAAGVHMHLRGILVQIHVGVALSPDLALKSTCGRAFRDVVFLLTSSASGTGSSASASDISWLWLHKTLVMDDILARGLDGRAWEGREELVTPLDVIIRCCVGGGSADDVGQQLSVLRKASQILERLFRRRHLALLKNAMDALRSLATVVLEWQSDNMAELIHAPLAAMLANAVVARHGVGVVSEGGDGAGAEVTVEEDEVDRSSELAQQREGLAVAYIGVLTAVAPHAHCLLPGMKDAEMSRLMADVLTFQLSTLSLTGMSRSGSASLTARKKGLVGLCLRVGLNDDAVRVAALETAIKLFAATEPADILRMLLRILQRLLETAIVQAELDRLHAVAAGWLRELEAMPSAQYELVAEELRNIKARQEIADRKQE